MYTHIFSVLYTAHVCFLDILCTVHRTSIIDIVISYGKKAYYTWSTQVQAYIYSIQVGPGVQLAILKQKKVGQSCGKTCQNAGFLLWKWHSSFQRLMSQIDILAIANGYGCVSPCLLLRGSTVCQKEFPLWNPSGKESIVKAAKKSEKIKFDSGPKHVALNIFEISKIILDRSFFNSSSRTDEQIHQRSNLF